MKIGVAGTDRQQEEDWIMEELENREHEAVFVNPSDVSYVLEDGDLEARYNGELLNELDILFIRRTRFDLEASRDLVAAMETIGIRTIERKDVFFNPLSKFYSLLNFVGEQVENVGVPATGIVKQEEDAAEIAETIGYPLIMKPVKGREGEGVKKIDAADELSDAIEGEEFPILLQQFLDIEEEYRVLVVGDKALGTVTKESIEDSDEVVRNYARGADFVPVDRPELDEPAAQIAKLMGIEVAGVDIVRTTDDEYYEIECNRCPQFKGFSKAHPDINVAKHIVDYIEEQG